MSEIQRADRAAHRKTIIFTVVAMVVLAPTLFYFNSYLVTIEDWLIQPGKTVERAKLIISVLIAIGAAFLLLVSILIYRFAGSVLRVSRYPPTNTKVIRDVRIRRGISARKIGRFMQVLSFVVLLLLVFLIVSGWFLIQNVDRLLN